MGHKGSLAFQEDPSFTALAINRTNSIMAIIKAVTPIKSPPCSIKKSKFVKIFHI